VRNDTEAIFRRRIGGGASPNFLDMLRCIMDTSFTATSMRSMRAGRVKGLMSSCRAPLRVTHRRPDTRGVPSPRKNPGRRARFRAVAVV
jgi:hypothetical protein